MIYLTLLDPHQHIHPYPVHHVKDHSVLRVMVEGELKEIHVLAVVRNTLMHSQANKTQRHPLVLLYVY